MPPIIHHYPRFERSKPRRVVSNWPVTGPGSMIFKVARKRRKPCKIYTRGPFLDSYRERVVPPRARSTWCGVGPAAEEKKRDTISFRPAGRSTELRSFLVITKLPLWKIRSALHSLCFLFHRRRYPSFLAILLQPPSAILLPPFSSLLPFFSTSSRNRQRIIPSSPFDYLSPLLRYLVSSSLFL